MTESIHTRLLGRDASFNVSGPWLAYWLVLLRLTAGWWMLHAGLDKLVNWPFDASWFVGGAAQGSILGPFVTMFSEGAALTFVNIAIPLGQTAIGLGLVLGCLTRAAAFFGAALLMFFYFINGQGGGWAHGVVTGELLGIMIMGLIATIGAGRILGIDAYLERMEFVQNRPKLRYLIG